MVVNIIVCLIYAAVLGGSVIVRCAWRRDMSASDWITVIICSAIALMLIWITVITCSAIVLMLMRSAMQIMM